MIDLEKTLEEAKLRAIETGRFQIELTLYQWEDIVKELRFLKQSKLDSENMWEARYEALMDTFKMCLRELTNKLDATK